MNARHYFKCQDLGYVASNCPNQKVFYLAEWESVKEEEKEEEEDEVVEEEENSKTK